MTLEAQAANPRSQFFASLEKWIGARNPVKLGSSCAAVTGYNFPLGQSPKGFGGEGGKKVRCRTGIRSQEPEYLSDPPHSAVAAIGDRGRRDHRSRLQPKKLLRKKKNESWAMRPRPYKSDSRSWRKLVCRIVQFGSFRSAHASRVLVSASRRNNLFLTRESLPLASQKKSSRSRRGHAITRDARAT